ncbi:hypothetical protein D9M72_540910 [compost metagenome]
MAPGRRKNNAVGKPTRNDAFQIVVRILLGGAEQGDKIELVTGKDGLNTVENAHEEGVALTGNFRAGLHHEADDAGRTLPERTARLVGDITKRFRCFEHPFSGVFVDVGLAVQRARYRADRDIEMFGKLANPLHFSAFLPRPATGHFLTS